MDSNIHGSMIEKAAHESYPQKVTPVNWVYPWIAVWGPKIFKNFHKNIIRDRTQASLSNGTWRYQSCQGGEYENKHTCPF